MMERLERALLAGGAVSRLSDGRYGVWRGRDKRGRIIGYLNDEQVMHWRLGGRLKRCGNNIPEVWVWGSNDTPATACLPPSPQSLQILDYVASDATYLARLILFQTGQAREDLILRIQSFRWDYAQIHVAAGISSMDWQGLSYGARIDRSPKLLREGDNGLRCAARRRLHALRDSLGDTDWQTWLRISVHLWSLRDFDRRAHIKAATLSCRLPRLIAALDEIYLLVSADD